MRLESIAETYRSIANRKVIRILSIGLGVSLLLHIIAILGISYWSNLNAEEEMEITTIERVELEAEPAPSISKSTSSPSAIPAKTAFNTSENPNFTPNPTTPQSKPQQSNGLPSATAIVTKNSQNTPPQNSSPTALAPTQKSSKSNHRPTESNTNTNLGNNDGGNNSTSQENSTPPSVENNNKSPSNGNGSAPNNINNSSKPNGSSPGDNGKSTTQCLRNCIIKYPDEFQDSDVGKGKISIRVTIDGNGIVSTAEIVRSSDNQKLDSFALAAIKKMQFNATGETRIRRIKVNTISNN